jgi:hypothetical protein
MFHEEYTISITATITANNNNSNITCLELEKIEGLDSCRDRCCYLVGITTISQKVFYFNLYFLSYEVLGILYLNMTIIQYFYGCNKLH